MFLVIVLAALISRCSLVVLPSWGSEKECVIGVESTTGRLGPGIARWDMANDPPCKLEVRGGACSRVWSRLWSALVPIQTHFPGFFWECSIRYTGLALYPRTVSPMKPPQKCSTNVPSPDSLACM